MDVDGLSVFKVYFQMLNVQQISAFKIHCIKDISLYSGLLTVIFCGHLYMPNDFLITLHFKF